MAVGDVDEVNSQLPSPHVEMIKVGDSFIIQTNPNCCKLQVIHKLQSEFLNYKLLIYCCKSEDFHCLHHLYRQGVCLLCTNFKINE